MKSIAKSVLFIILVCVISSKDAINQNQILENNNTSRTPNRVTFSLNSSVVTDVNENIELQKSVRLNGRFTNPWPTWKSPALSSVFKFILDKDHSNVPSKEEELNKSLPLVKPDFKFDRSRASFTWIGHSTAVVNLDNVTVLTDPIFSSRASLTQWMGPSRYRRPAVNINELPPIDAVVISHNHYDHLDLNSVEALNSRFGEELYWFVPLQLADWMRSVGCKNVVELDWWERSSIPNKPDIKFVFTPAQHWTKRGLNDDCKVLWGSWSIIGPNYRFFFAGDTGYCPVFKQIGKEFGPFDISAIPIGAYEPRWVTGPYHVDPEEAVQIHKDVKSKLSVGIHWGTFALAHEHYLEPREKLKKALLDQELHENEFITLKHGESKVI